MDEAIAEIAVLTTAEGVALGEKQAADQAKTDAAAAKTTLEAEKDTPSTGQAAIVLAKDGLLTTAVNTLTTNENQLSTL